MKAIALACLALSVLSAPALAAPTDGQKAAFRAVCIGTIGNAELCGCEADVAMDVLDEHGMNVLIAAMNGTSTPSPQDQAAYDHYLDESNRICTSSH